MMSFQPEEDCDTIKFKIAYKEQVFLTYFDQAVTLEKLYQEIRQFCKFSEDRPFTSKWIDDEGDPCTISSQMELEEAIRLTEINKDPELTLHVFNNVPSPGKLCVGETKQIYRKNAKRWRTHYRIKGHLLEPKRFNRNAYCAFCSDRIWGLGRQGLKCTQCKILVHTRCYKNVSHHCTTETATTTRPQQITEDVPYTVFTRGSSDSLQIESANQKHYTPDDFNLIKVVGRGSYAKVLMVELKETKSIYAMKVIKKDRLTDEDLEWVQTEKHVFELASNHPFLVGLHSCFQTPSRLFFITEFARGGDLMYHMQRQNKLPEDNARFYTAEISLALHFLHSKGIIYRDLKLDNVLLDHEGHIKLTDYGMCKEGINRTGGTTTLCGTPNYIAPEVLLGKYYSFSVDWWALGILLYEMLAGRSPFFSDDPDHSSEDYLFQTILEEPIRIPRFLSAKASSILRGFLNKVPSERLGCRDLEGFMEIVNHPFFRPIPWDSLEARQIAPPYVPELKSEKDLTHFPAEFLSEPVQFSMDDPNLMKILDQSEFEGFEYVNPFLMSQSVTV